MNKNGILSFLLSFFLSVSFAQSVPVSAHLSDQVVLGPCYIFSTVAALESKAMQGGAANVNFNEWQFYSTCVLGTLSGNGDNMIAAVADHISDHGAYSGAHSSPTSSDCPNPNDPLVPCIADFNCSLNATWCQDKTYQQTPEGYCVDNENNKFEFDLSFGSEYCLQGGVSTIDVEGMSVTQKKQQVINLLSQGKGVIANFKNWTATNGCASNNSGGHSVFIYSHVESVFSYKDSWPCNPSFSNANLPWRFLTDLYYITGSVNYCGNTPICNLSINGGSTVGGNTNYSLSGSASNISWSVSGNLSIVGSNANSTVTIRPNSCSNGSGTVSVTYNGGCSKSKPVYVLGRSPRPSSIAVLSSNWNGAGQTCPNTLLELEAIVNGNYGNLIYDWSISGATLLSGQGSPTVFVQTPSYNSNLVFRVRTRRANCPFSGWRTIYGNSSSSNPGCGGGGGYVSSGGESGELDFLKFFNTHEDLKELTVNIFSVKGENQ